jgi:hypothetical protein
MRFKLIPGIVAAVQLQLALSVLHVKPGNISPLRDPDSKQNLKKGFGVLGVRKVPSNLRAPTPRPVQRTPGVALHVSSEFYDRSRRSLGISPKISGGDAH